MSRFIRAVLDHLGYSIARKGRANRFNATPDLLRHLASAAYDPQLIIDGGSNEGQWAHEARTAIPRAHIHLVEPQPGLATNLDRTAASDGRMTVHKVALAAASRAELPLNGVGSTGAWIPRDGQQAEPGAVHVPARTLDELFADIVSAADRTLLKLDLEGYELEALTGASRLLRAAEVVFIEVAFYPIEDPTRPTFADIHAMLSANDFVLYDVGSLADRRRDGRLRAGDVVYVKRTSPLTMDTRFG